MFSKKELKKAWQLSSLDKAAMFEPNERFILWLIANDESAFTLPFVMDATKRGLAKPNIPDANFSKALAIYMTLMQRGYVKNVNYDKNKITWRGKLYRIYTHPSLVFWTLIVTAIGVVAAILLSLSPIKTKSIINKTKSPSYDSALYLKNVKDSAKKK